MSQQRPKALWGGRFTESTDSFVQAFTASVEFDRRMAKLMIERPFDDMRVPARLRLVQRLLLPHAILLSRPFDNLEMPSTSG